MSNGVVIPPPALRDTIEHLERLDNLLRATGNYVHMVTGRFREAEAVVVYQRHGFSPELSRFMAACPLVVVRLSRRFDDLKALEREHAQLLTEAADMRRRVEELEAMIRLASPAQPLP